MSRWQPDILGPGFEQQTLELGEDAEGPVVATVVRSIPNPVIALTRPLHDVDVLSVHGWSDYFFQPEQAHFWTSLGARFYALDLRKYGRSLRPGQTPGFVTNLDDYDADIAAALTAMGRDAATGRRLVLLGHSTGGLTLSLWAARFEHEVHALVLNSPWLELQTGGFGRQALAPIVGVRAKYDPLGTQPVVDLGFYTRAQTEVGALPVPGYRQEWRPERGFATHPGWLSAVLTGHAQVAAGLGIDVPTLVLLSARSTMAFSWVDAMTSTDSVLVVDDIARAATRLGSRVTIGRIDGAIHDVFLSRAESREEAYGMLRQWLTRSAL
ncbi:alpha/beta hydrolase [Microbacterium fluvii]|uniref:Alpha/beta hydrolase n=1 Tax=Microbacterium fluvii TaxID=415215 RepID=A0ABW2HIG4_9MICO|nr:alpha/beta hydrolase [Microbacterium fluvii]MCU4673424.1 alpha/beta hydrolase [Microbacterium fluvii]